MIRVVKFPRGCDRREFLAGLRVLGAGVLLNGRTSFAQGPAAGAGRIDLHHHFTAPGWRKALSDAGMLPEVRQKWTPQVSLDHMDKAGVSIAMVSTGQAGWRLGELNNNETTRLTRDANEFGARMVADGRGRFRLLANLPLPDLDASIKEIAYALDTLKAEGFGITTSYGGKYIGDPTYVPLLTELNRRKALVYTHPTEPMCCGDIIPNLIPNTIEYGTDTTRMIMSLIVSGAAEKFPEIRWVFSHAGGTMPFLVERIDSRYADNLDAPPAPKSRASYLRKFYYDTAQTSNRVAMRALRDVVGMSQIVFGADFPYSTIADHVDGLQKSGVFTAAELRMVDRENALRLIPSLRTAS